MSPVSGKLRLPRGLFCLRTFILINYFIFLFNLINYFNLFNKLFNLFILSLLNISAAENFLPTALFSLRTRWQIFRTS